MSLLVFIYFCCALVVVCFDTIFVVVCLLWVGCFGELVVCALVWFGVVMIVVLLTCVVVAVRVLLWLVFGGFGCGVGC